MPTPQKLRRVADRAKALEEIVAKMEEATAKMEEDHKAQIDELEARVRDTSQEDKQVRVEAFRLASAQMQSRIDDALSVLDDATSTWSELDEPLEKV